MSTEFSRLLQKGQETIVRNWTEKVASDRRVSSDSKLTYMQLVDHVPQIVEELRHALADSSAAAQAMREGQEHGWQRWRQGYDLKEIVRELALLRVTLLEFIDTYRGALVPQSPEQFARSYRQINGFIDEEIYRSIEAYLEAARGQQPGAV